MWRLKLEPGRLSSSTVNCTMNKCSARWTLFQMLEVYLTARIMPSQLLFLRGELIFKHYEAILGRATSTWLLFTNIFKMTFKQMPCPVIFLLLLLNDTELFGQIVCFHRDDAVLYLSSLQLPWKPQPALTLHLGWVGTGIWLTCTWGGMCPATHTQG